jgi:hypothetical protein
MIVTLHDNDVLLPVARPRLERRAISLPVAHLRSEQPTISLRTFQQRC